MKTITQKLLKKKIKTDNANWENRTIKRRIKTES